MGPDSHKVRSTRPTLSASGWELKSQVGDGPPGQSSIEKLAELLAERMAAAWRRGERPLVEDFLASHPEVGQSPDAAARLIYEEICLRAAVDQELPPIELMRRFPQWSSQVGMLLDCHSLVKTGPVEPNYPKVGEKLGDYQLLADLGQGLIGCVFLAIQPSLADRPVVLKVTRCAGGEHLSLARLQHTHVVPLYAVHDFPELNLRAICMPYLGGATLAQLLEALCDVPFHQRSGAKLLDTLDRSREGAAMAFPERGPARQFLARASYAQAVCWIGACLAEALNYAHERNLLHLDLKPSNVLLAADGQPMLLDFHLAREPIRVGGPPPGQVGGTLAYLSPEQGAAMAAEREKRAISEDVDGRSDVYSLGVLLHEALTGTLPLDYGASTPELPRENPQVTVGLADVLARCLARNPRDRYPDAAALAADLRRHLSDQPLRGVVNRSPTERWRKWRRRHPYAPALIAMILTVTGAAMSTALIAIGRVGQLRREARVALAVGRGQLEEHRPTEAVQVLSRGLASARCVAGARDLVREISDLLYRAKRAEMAQNLHRVAESARFLYGVDPPADSTMRTLEARCRALWQLRDRILGDRQQRLDPDTEREMKTDLLDLVLIGLDLRVRLATPAAADDARAEAVRVLDEAERTIESSAVLNHERQTYARASLRDPESGTSLRGQTEITPRTAWDHYALGRSFLQAGDLSAAVLQFERAVELQPQGFWPNFYLGVCAFRLGRYEQAVGDFRVCIALAPGSAPSYANRGLAFAALGQLEQARRDDDRALALDPTLTAATSNRGVVNLLLGRVPEAVADLQHALENTIDPAVVALNLMHAFPSRDGRLRALEQLRHAIRLDPRHARVQALLDSLQEQPPTKKDGLQPERLSGAPPG